MRRGSALIACFLGLLFAAPAAALPKFGVAEDSPKYAADGGAREFELLRELGMSVDRVTVLWDDLEPATIQEQHGIERLVDAADKAGIELVFQVFPRRPRAFEQNVDAQTTAFAEYVAKVARTFPTVKRFIVLNEPNEAFFQVPQFSRGKVASAATALKALAKSYDALKAVDARITVIGLGLSPEANDRSSVSPVRFLAALGDAYRRSGRRKPLMDELALHLYPKNAATQDERTRYAWPNTGPSDLDRIKQAVWDAFQGTAQPVFQETAQPVGPVLRLTLDEVGWQVRIPPSIGNLYTSSENTPVTTEDRQARVYRALIAKLGCDPTVSRLLFFHLVDERDLRRFQSGLLRADDTRRPAFAAVAAAIRSAGSCAARTIWRHRTTVAGARAWVPRSARVSGRPSVRVTAAEGALATVSILDQARRVVARKTVRIAAGRRPLARVAAPGVPGRYLVQVRFASEVNSDRETVLTRPLRVGEV